MALSSLCHLEHVVRQCSLCIIRTNVRVFWLNVRDKTHATSFTLELDLNRAMDHPIIHRLLRTSFESWKQRDNYGSWSPPAFLETYFTTVAMISCFLDYVNALDVSSSLPFVTNLQELVSLLSFELVQCLANPYSVPRFQMNDPDEGRWTESTRLQLERFQVSYINLFRIQDDSEKTKLTNVTKAIKTHLEQCAHVSDDELWSDLWQWSVSLGSLNAHIEWEVRPFQRPEAQSSGHST